MIDEHDSGSRQKKSTQGHDPDDDDGTRIAAAAVQDHDNNGVILFFHWCDGTYAADIPHNQTTIAEGGGNRT
jgi:phosphatidylethanolamine-binding protein (PEBP) family uncharacterized protein